MKAILDIDKTMEDLGEVWGVCQTEKGTMFTANAPSLEELKDLVIQIAWEEHNEWITDFDITDLTNGIPDIKY